MAVTTIYGNTTPVDAYKELVCLSTDTKPTTNVGNGSLIRELDTGDIYTFTKSGETGTWGKMFSIKEE